MILCGVEFLALGLLTMAIKKVKVKKMTKENKKQPTIDFDATLEVEQLIKKVVPVEDDQEDYFLIKTDVHNLLMHIVDAVLDHNHVNGMRSDKEAVELIKKELKNFC